MACSKLVFLEGQRACANSFFKANHPSTEKPRALVGFELGTEPETGDSHSTSTPVHVYPWNVGDSRYSFFVSTVATALLLKHVVGPQNPFMQY